MDRLYHLNHSPINALFVKNSDNFVVEEKPLYPFSEEGEHLILKIRKKDLTTWELISIIASFLNIKQKEIGYAGLKDKHGMTIQHLSLLKKYEARLQEFSHPNIKILEQFYHKNKLKIGHLQGNRFFIRLKKVNPVDANKIINITKVIASEGMPNYFGFQRFGKEEKNYEIGKAIVEQRQKIKDAKKRKFFINAYQSHLFNLWLSKRIEMSKMFANFNHNELSTIYNLPLDIIKKITSQKSFFKLLPGDVAMHYPYGKAFCITDIEVESKRFANKQISPTGLLCGAKTIKADGIAFDIEKSFIDNQLESYANSGNRRYGWIFVEDVDAEYIEQKAWIHLNFTLPKGSYATVFLEELLHQNLELSLDE
jgi:tRNA pseudouridine13 synthase